MDQSLSIHIIVIIIKCFTLIYLAYHPKHKNLKYALLSLFVFQIVFITNKYKENKEGVIFSNRGGWQSPSDFWKEISFSKYYNYILSQYRFYHIHYNNPN